VLRLIDLVYHSTLGLSVTKKREQVSTGPFHVGERTPYRGTSLIRKRVGRQVYRGTSLIRKRVGRQVYRGTSLIRKRVGRQVSTGPFHAGVKTEDGDVYM